ncbi:ABC-type siderophore export system fused ATPase/permease subunit [Streptomyces canus]
MGTSLTPEFWTLFTVLLVTFTVATVAVSAVLDTLVLRMRRRRQSGRRVDAPVEQPERHLVHR